MLEKPTRKKVDKQDNGRPTNIEQLIEKYDLERLWPYIEKMVNYTNTIIDKAYPIGSIYMSVNQINPSVLFGGTWVAWGTGRVPVGVDITQSEFDTVEETGGSKTQTLHNENLPQRTMISTYYNGGTISYSKWEGGNIPAQWIASDLDDLGNTNSQPFNIVQPYITCYMWKRIA